MIEDLPTQHNLGELTGIESKVVEEVDARWIELRGGPCEGGKLPVPVNSSGDIVLHSTPIDVDPWQDQDGEWHAGNVMGGEPLGASHLYHLNKGEDFANYVPDHVNPSDEGEDGDLVISRPYLENVSIVEGERETQAFSPVRKEGESGVVLPFRRP